MLHNEIIKYRDGDFELDVNLSPTEETVWLNLEQIGKLFEKDRSVIGKHIKNIFMENELEKDTCRAFFAQDLPDGRKFNVEFFNLDVIISVGYRVKSKRAILFRKWASEIIKQYLLKGYSINEKRIIQCEKNILELQIGILKLEARDYVNLTYTPNTTFEGISTIINLFSQAKKQIIIVDNYFCHDFDKDLKTLNVKIIVITDPKNTKIESCDLYEVHKTKRFHDRYIIIDDTCFHCGSSLRSLGEKVSTISKIKDLNASFFLSNL